MKFMAPMAIPIPKIVTYVIDVFTGRSNFNFFHHCDFIPMAILRVPQTIDGFNWQLFPTFECSKLRMFEHLRE